MPPVNMDNKANNGDWEVFYEDQEDDALSLCDLPMQESSTENYNSSSSSSAVHSPRTNEFFEFSNELGSLDDDHDVYPSTPDIIFCGKLMMREDEEELHEFQTKGSLTVVKSDSFRDHESEEPRRIFNTTKPFRFSSPKSQTHSSSYHRHHHPQDQKVNISSLTSMSAKSRRRMFMFGPVKFKPEMELSAIKERQGKRLNTLQQPPAVLDGGNEAVVGDSRKKISSSSSHWGVVKLKLRCRAYLSSLLARLFVLACVPAPASGGDNWINFVD